MYYLMLSKSTKCITTPSSKIRAFPLSSPVDLNLSLSLSGFNVVDSKIGGLNLFLWMVTLVLTSRNPGLSRMLRPYPNRK